jgi:superoxide dismutase, Fe-Mn family
MFMLPELPYDDDALAPHISGATLALHHGKHHKSYIDKLNGLLSSESETTLSLEDIILAARDDTAKQAVFDNAAQCWNHEFYWQSMAPDGGGAPHGAIKDLINVSFGDAKAFGKAFSDAAAAHFGSGWIWLVMKSERLEIMTTHDADLPLAHDRIALLTCDLWEHAYYVDYQNRRPEYIAAFQSNLVNWNFANTNLAAARVPMPT